LRALAGLLGLVGLSACISLNWERQSFDRPVVPEVLASLQSERSDLAHCLELLGAPLWVWEHSEERRDGAALAYGWLESRDLGLRVSVPVADRVSASFDYDQIDSRMRGAVLFFDHENRLVAWRLGLLRDLAREVQERPSYLEDDEPEPTPRGS